MRGDCEGLSEELLVFFYSLVFFYLLIMSFLIHEIHVVNEGDPLSEAKEGAKPQGAERRDSLSGGDLFLLLSTGA